MEEKESGDSVFQQPEARVVAKNPTQASFPQQKKNLPYDDTIAKVERPCYNVNMPKSRDV